jgi:large subunit ribosomal protein L20
MPRVKGGNKRLKRRKKILKLAKGFYGGRKNQFRTAMEAVDKSLQYAYVGRKLKKRDFRSLWITRINAAAREQGLTYSRLIEGLKNAKVGVNRKMMAELAVNHPQDFARLTEIARTNLSSH